jgi:hypothetical protein
MAPERKKGEPMRREIPQPSIWDGVLEAAKAGTSSLVPGYGGFLAQVFLSTIPTPLSRREREFFESLNERLEKLEERGDITTEELAKNDVFITAALQAYQMAMRNHQSEKLGALRNAVLNSALPGAPDESLQLIFLNFVEGFSPWHMQILKFVHDPSAWMKERNIPVPDWSSGSLRNLFSIAFKDMKRPSGLDDFIFQDLQNRGLFEGLGGLSTMRAVLRSRTTDLGKSFLKFITSPLEKESPGWE